MTAPSGETQHDLFGAPAPTPAVAPIDPSPQQQALAAALPEAVRLGTMSWAYPGWAGIVYRAPVAAKALPREGLRAYARHPLLRTVEIDRTHYQPLPAAAMADYAAQVPDDFRFLVKAHEDCTVARFPPHPRYGKRRGEANPRALDPGYAAAEVIAPIVEGLGPKLGTILFQFPPHEFGDVDRFADRLHAFLRALPKGPVYAVELRHAALLTPAYGDALAAAGAVHCHTRWTAMPPIHQQARTLPAATRRPLVVRWMLRPGDAHGDAGARYEPFDRLRDEDPGNRDLVADLVARAVAHDVPALVTVDNKAEGCAPESVVRLAAAIAARLAARRQASTLRPGADGS
jgi:uncharacterized protein YecE (DUF72 family)